MACPKLRSHADARPTPCRSMTSSRSVLDRLETRLTSIRPGTREATFSLESSIGGHPTPTSRCVDAFDCTHTGQRFCARAAWVIGGLDRGHPRRPYLHRIESSDASTGLSIRGNERHAVRWP